MSAVSAVRRAHETGKVVNIGLWIVQVVLAAMFLMAGGSKLAGAPAMIAVFEKIGVGQWFRYVTGGFEVAGAIGLLIPRTAGWAAVLLACVMAGAVIAHLTVLGGNPAVPIALLVLAILVAWGGEIDFYEQDENCSRDRARAAYNRRRRGDCPPRVSEQSSGRS